MTRRLAPRLKRLSRELAEHDIEKVAKELGAGGPGNRGWLVVRVMPGETERQARTRAFAMNPWVAELSPAARDRLQLIVVVRGHVRSEDPGCRAAAWAEARQLHEAGAELAEVVARTGLPEAEVRERAALEEWGAADGISA